MYANFCVHTVFIDRMPVCRPHRRKWSSRGLTPAQILSNPLCRDKAITRPPHEETRGRFISWRRCWFTSGAVEVVNDRCVRMIRLLRCQCSEHKNATVLLFLIRVFCLFVRLCHPLKKQHSVIPQRIRK